MDAILSELSDSLRRIRGRSAAYFAYEDPCPESARGNGSGALSFVRDDSRRVDRVEIAVTPPDRGWLIHKVITQELLCEKLFVEDLHHTLLRCDEAVAHVGPLNDSIVDIAFCKAWKGLSHCETADLAKQTGQSIPALGMALWESLSETAKEYYRRCYLPVILSYARHEQKPIAIHDGQFTRMVWVHYKFTSGKTSRLAPKEHGYSQKRHLFNPHSIAHTARAKFVRAQPGHKIVTIDYNAAEMRTLAALSGDKHLQKVFATGVDLYKLVLSGIKQEGLDRALVKATVLQLFYGGWKSSVAYHLGIEPKAIAGIEDRMRDFFPDAWGYLDDLADQGIADGHVETCTGRVFPLQDPKAARRQIPNAVIQSVTADLNNVMFARLILSCVRSRPLFHIHDGYVFEIPDHCLEEETEFLVESAEQNPLKRFLPGVLLRVEAKTGDVWQ